MCSDRKRDGIKDEHIIFTQACLRSGQSRTNNVYVSASAGQIWSWGGGGADLKKNVRTSGKSWLHPRFSPVPFVFLQLTFVFDHFLLDFQ